MSPACLRHVLSTEGTGWFGPEKLTEVIDIYENSQMYLSGKYSKLSGTGSAKPGGCLFRSQNVGTGNSQNSAAYPRWKTGRSSQANSTPSRCWLCGEIGHKAVHHRKNVVLVENQRLVSTMSKLNQSNATVLQLKPEINPVPI